MTEREMKRLPVDLEEIIFLASFDQPLDSEYQASGYVDVETGAVHCVLADALAYWEGDLAEDELGQDAKTDLPVAEQIVEGMGSRFIRIEPMDSRAAFEVMESFARQCPDARAGEQLFEALSRNKPFRRFKDLVDSWSGLRDVWFAFKDRAEREIVKEWLREYGVEAEDASQHPVKPLPKGWEV